MGEQRGNARLARFVRDFLVTSGNFWARIGDDGQAKKAYLAALDGERLLERKALIHFNLAKLNYAGQDLMATLAHLTEARPDKVGNTRLRDGLTLLRVRVCMGIGQYQDAQEALAKTRLRGMPSVPTSMERTYLGFMLRAMSESWRSAARLEDMERWASALAPREIGDYYRCELMVVRRFAFPASVGAVSRQRGRLALLAKSAQASIFLTLWDTAAELFRAGKDRPPLATLNAFHELGFGQHNVLFNCLSILAIRELMRRRRFQVAMALTASFEYHVHRQLAALSPSQRRRFDVAENRGLALVSSLTAKIPDEFRRDLDAARQWLVLDRSPYGAP